MGLKKKYLVYIAGLAFIAALVWGSYFLVTRPMIPKTNAPIILTVAPNTSAFRLAQLLKEKQLIHSSRLFLYWIRAKGLTQQLKAGAYQIKPGETVFHLLNRIVAGDVLMQHFKIIEGRNLQKVEQDLSAAAYLNYNPKDWLLIQKGHLNAEGLLLADTYSYQGGSNSKILLEQAHQQLMHYLNQSWATRAADLPYKNAYELLIAASIIEKETALAQEKKLIAGVMVNRLKKQMPLQMDPTVIYALGKAYTGKLTHSDLQVSSLYNSYRYRGLPPTPICMVGKEAIDAAAHPQLSQYLYFFAKGDGSHQFSVNYEQQKQAINRYKNKDL